MRHARLHPFPHSYVATANGGRSGDVVIGAPRLPAVVTAAPEQFGGPSDRWSPETLLVAAVADCFVLSFRAISRAAGFAWHDLECRVEGILERVDGVAQFSHFRTRAVLTVPNGSDVAQARQLLEKAERGCLIANSLRATRELAVEIDSPFVISETDGCLALTGGRVQQTNSHVAPLERQRIALVE